MNKLIRLKNLSLNLIKIITLTILTLNICTAAKTTASARASTLCTNGMADGYLDGKEECDLGNANNDDPNISGCTTSCTIQKTGNWKCTKTQQEYEKQMSILNPNSLAMLYIFLTLPEIEGPLTEDNNYIDNGNGSITSNNGTTIGDQKHIISSSTANIKCKPDYTPLEGETPVLIQAVCNKYKQNLALFKDLNRQISVKTGLGDYSLQMASGSKFTYINSTKDEKLADCTQAFMLDVLMPPNALEIIFDKPLKINCKPDPDQGIK